MMNRLNLYLIFICAIAFPLKAHSAEFFNDSFESGDLSYTGSNGASWTSSGHTSVSQDRSHTGSYSLKFTFSGNADLAVDATAEQRFSLSDTYDEIYIRFYVYFPSNYTLRETPSTENTKLFYLWGDDYQADMNKVGIEFETALSGWPKAKKDWDGLTCSGDTGYMGGLTGGGIDIAGARGSWTAIEIHTRRDTGSGDGIMQVWQDGSLVVDGSGLSWVGAPCGLSQFFKNGYLMGWSNAGFDNDTYVYIDDVVFSTSYIGTGTTPVTAPTVAITSPTTNSTYQTESSTINVSGTASDDGTVSSVTWACPTCTPTSGTATDTTSWSISSIGLASGNNTITVTATDDESNTSTDTLSVLSGTPGVLAWSAASYNASRDDGYAYADIARTGGSDGTVSIQWMTLGDTAVYDTDYIGSNGNVVTFADGDVLETIQVPLVDREEAENLSFSVILSDPVSATLGSQSTATITILGDGSSPTCETLESVCDNATDCNTYWSKPYYYDGACQSVPDGGDSAGMITLNGAFLTHPTTGNVLTIEAAQ